MARDAGWKRINGDWVCPGCQENLAKVKQVQAAPNNLISHNQ
jgi:rubredoxin